uniref:Uncharacterized protein n=1 Tax=Pristionchus pacificus TaxID=54126 RepID=A0A8R1Z5N5_PRIPA
MNANNERESDGESNVVLTGALRSDDVRPRDDDVVVDLEDAKADDPGRRFGGTVTSPRGPVMDIVSASTPKNCMLNSFAEWSIWNTKTHVVHGRQEVAEVLADVQSLTDETVPDENEAMYVIAWFISLSHPRLQGVADGATTNLAVDEFGHDVVDVVVVFDGGVRDDDDDGIGSRDVGTVEDIPEHGADRTRAVCRNDYESVEPIGTLLGENVERVNELVAQLQNLPEYRGGHLHEPSQRAVPPFWN